MNKLLSAGFARLWKNKVFWIGMILMPAYTIIVLCGNYYDMVHYGASYNINYTPDGFLTGCFLFIGMFTAVFSSLFLGTEYSDGTVRNKLVIGHGRADIYLSNLIVCLVASLLVCLACILATFAFCLPLFGAPQSPLPLILQKYGIGFLMVAAFSGIYTLIAMLISNKPISTVICTLSIFALLFAAIYVMNRLAAPEIWEDYYELSVSGEVVCHPMPNPNYLRGTARKIYEFLRDLLPTGQGIQLSSGDIPYPIRACLCSLFLILSTTIVGARAFCKKDLK